MKYLKYILLLLVTCVVIVAVWLLLHSFAANVKNAVLITPKKGITCIVVTPLFSSSVDCWKDDIKENNLNIKE